ncbi:hypothetical protein AB4341_17410 [Vibrio breoganii]
MKKLLILLTLTALTTGCVNRVGDFTVASTKNVDMNDTHFTEGARVEGSDTTIAIILPLGTPSVKEAMDNAIEKDRCAVALNDAVVDNGFFYLYLGAFWMDVEGTLIMDESKEGCEGAGKRSREQALAQASSSKKKSTSHSRAY